MASSCLNAVVDSCACDWAGYSYQHDNSFTITRADSTRIGRSLSSKGTALGRTHVDDRQSLPTQACHSCGTLRGMLVQISRPIHRPGILFDPRLCDWEGYLYKHVEGNTDAQVAFAPWLTVHDMSTEGPAVHVTPCRVTQRASHVTPCHVWGLLRCRWCGCVGSGDGPECWHDHLDL